MLIEEFTGQLDTMLLISTNCCFGPRPKEDEEYEQELTINANGSISIVRYSVSGRILCEPEEWALSEKKVSQILQAVSEYFGALDAGISVTDVGIWKLILTNTEGKTFEYEGSLCEDLYVGKKGLSKLIRKQLGLEDLFVFDGEAEIPYPRFDVEGIKLP